MHTKTNSLQFAQWYCKFSHTVSIRLKMYPTPFFSLSLSKKKRILYRCVQYQLMIICGTIPLRMLGFAVFTLFLLPFLFGYFFCSLSFCSLSQSISRAVYSMIFAIQFSARCFLVVDLCFFPYPLLLNIFFVGFQFGENYGLPAEIHNQATGY